MIKHIFLVAISVSCVKLRFFSPKKKFAIKIYTVGVFFYGRSANRKPTFIFVMPCHGYACMACPRESGALLRNMPVSA